MKGKTFQITHCCICTKDNLIVEGGEYYYKEGSLRKNVILEKVLQNDEWLQLQVFFPDIKKRIKVKHINDNYGYSGMWRIFDWDEQAKMEIAEAENYHKSDSKPLAPQPKHTKRKYIESLSEDTLVNILRHFNALYDCTKLEDREMNMVWLAWLLGEELLFLTESFIISNYGEVEYDLNDFNVTMESDTSDSINIELLSNYYALDKLYTGVLKYNRPSMNIKTKNL